MDLLLGVVEEEDLPFDVVVVDVPLVVLALGCSSSLDDDAVLGAMMEKYC